ncbi:MAG: 16S rRNA (cytidine(1402)-2'-O)-methyltransferase [Gammaproteobacteria bacterium]|nr:16S rRNA (cytidine(1402)-2'-O)-methyltransferase [Gammaproteobacteria bacterium]
MGTRVSKVHLEVSNTSGKLYVVATPIGNLDDVTLRALQVLRSVDRIAAEDTRHSRRLLDHYGIVKPMIALHEHNELDAVSRVLSSLQAGESLALVSDAGTPLISDPGFPLVRACRAHAIPVIPVPGASALLAALSVSGLPTDRFCFEGFLPRRAAARIAQLERLRHASATMVFYESSHRIVDTLRDMQQVFGGDRPAVFARELTKLHETVRAASLAELSGWVADDGHQRLGEIVILIAGVPQDEVPPGLQVDDVLRVLLAELPVRQAAGLAARLTGGKKNALYRRALELSGG